MVVDVALAPSALQTTEALRVAGILRLTRAERSACGHHFALCRTCREWANTIVIAVLPEQVARLRAAKSADFLDPEAHHYTAEERRALLEEEEPE